ncbi:MAG TPA: hypothetical protein VM864_09790 [Pyrinomonadaceae bacterium]|jgi:hypothetical protein|nr:hypothetical protein [Pyrinomonadaceae bacterium]
MNDLGILRGQLIKRVLPFMLALLVGVAAFSVAHYKLRRTRETSAPQGAPVATEAQAEPRELPELHVLSPMLMEEVLEYERRGGYETPRITFPEGVQYSSAKRRPYRQGVLQLNFLFGADGTISEIVPLAKRHDCGVCLRGPNVVVIDPRDPRWSEQVEAAKLAVARLKFAPGTSAGQPAGMHGLAECVFRLE